MKREQLEHIIQASCAITGQSEIVIIGSQSILGQFPNAPQELLALMEADVFPLRRPDLAINIDGAIGEKSLFHETFGYWAHGVDETTATLPARWQERLVPVHNENTGGGTGLCLEVHDLAASKLVAGREKDISFVKGMLRARVVNPRELAAVLPPCHYPQRKRHCWMRGYSGFPEIEGRNVALGNSAPGKPDKGGACTTIPGSEHGLSCTLFATIFSCSQLNARVRNFFSRPQERPQDTNRPTRQ